MLHLSMNERSPGNQPPPNLPPDQLMDWVLAEQNRLTSIILEFLREREAEWLPRLRKGDTLEDLALVILTMHDLEKTPERDQVNQTVDRALAKIYDDHLWAELDQITTGASPQGLVERITSLRRVRIAELESEGYFEPADILRLKQTYEGILELGPSAQAANPSTTQE